MVIHHLSSCTGAIYLGYLSIYYLCRLSTLSSAWSRSLNPPRSRHVQFWPCSSGPTSKKRKFVSGGAFPDGDDELRHTERIEIKKLWEWADLQDCEGLESCTVKRNSATGVRGLFAVNNSDFEPGDYVLAIPFSATMLIRDNMVSDDVLSPEQVVGQLLNADSDVLEGYAFWKKICREADSSDQQRWTPFVESLPKINDVNFDPTPDFWSEEQIQQLEIPRLVEESIQRKQQVTSLAMATDTRVEALQWATWIIRSRGFTTMRVAHSSQDGVSEEEDALNNNSVGLHSRTFLIPIIDMINHSMDPNTELDVLEVPDSFDESLFALRAIKTINQGDELTICYGTGLETSLDLFSRYGFWMNENPADANLNWMSIDQQWTTSLEDDRGLVTSHESLQSDVMRTALNLRMHLKKLLQDSQHIPS